MAHRDFWRQPTSRMVRKFAPANLSTGSMRRQTHFPDCRSSDFCFEGRSAIAVSLTCIFHGVAFDEVKRGFRGACAAPAEPENHAELAESMGG